MIWLLSLLGWLAFAIFIETRLRRDYTPKKKSKYLPVQDRTYYFITGQRIRLLDVDHLITYASGCHICRCLNGESHVVPPWWFQCVITFPGEPGGRRVVEQPSWQ